MVCDAKLWQHICSSSVVICAADLFAVAVGKLEHDSVLLVHADTVEVTQFSSQFLQSVRGGRPQVHEGCTRI